MEDNDNYYDKFCKDEFKQHGEKIDELMVTVKNGLTHRVTRIDRLTWLILGLLVAKWVSEYFL